MDAIEKNIVSAYKTLSDLWKANNYHDSFLEAMAAIEQANPELCDSFWEIFYNE